MQIIFGSSKLIEKCMSLTDAFRVGREPKSLKFAMYVNTVHILRRTVHTDLCERYTQMK